MMPGLIVLTRAPHLPHRTASAITRSAFARFDDCRHGAGPGHLEHWESEHLIGRRLGKSHVLLARQR
jgi:hypothetical protein